MPFTALQLTTFFTSNLQMALTPDQREALQREGLVTVHDFEDFKEEELKVAFKNARSGIPGTPTVQAIPEVRAQDGSVIQALVQAIPGTPGVRSVPIPAKCITRLLIASVAYNYYKHTGREITNTSMHFTNVLREFHVEWNAMLSMAEQEAPSLPMLTKNNPPLKWCESFKNFLYATFGVRKIPLLYVIRENEDVTPENGIDPNATYDPLQTGKAYGSSGSVLQDLILRLSHDHPLFKTDNSTVYGFIEEATRGSNYSHTIKPFSRTKNGRGAWLAIITSHVGINQWEKIEKENSSWLLNASWNGKKYALESFCSQHRAKFQQLEEASQHLNFQLPNEHTRVGYLLNNIQNSDPALQAALASIRQDKDGLRNKFEDAVAILIPVDPFVQNKAHKRTTSYEISSVVTNNGRGSKSGVELRWHKPNEYKALTHEQKDELREWQNSNDGKRAIADAKESYFKNKKRRKANDNSNSEGNSKKKYSARIASLEKQISEQAAELKEQQKLAEISSALKSNKSSQPADQLSLARTMLKIATREDQSSS